MALSLPPEHSLSSPLLQLRVRDRAPVLQDLEHVVHWFHTPQTVKYIIFQSLPQLFRLQFSLLRIVQLIEYSFSDDF